jgi:apolipoprotein N-acyltransferase
MQFRLRYQAILPALISGVLLGLSVNYSIILPLAFFMPFSLLGLFSTLEKRNSWKQWFVPTYFFWLVSIGLVLFGFIWVDPIAGTIMVVLASFVYTLPFLILLHLQNRFQLNTTTSFGLLALLWPAFEWFVCERLLEFPITLFANGLANYPIFIQFIDITGYTGISFWVIILNVFVFLIYKAQKQKTKNQHQSIKKLIGITVIWIALPLIYAWYAFTSLPKTFNGEVKVAVIQSDYSSIHAQLDSNLVFPKLSSTIHLTDSAIVNSKPDLVVWPEGALPASVRSSEASLLFITDRVLRWQTPLITGIFDTEPTPKPIPALQKKLGKDFFLYNAVSMITPQFSWKVLMEDVSGNPLRTYRKVHLMPFMEYVPLSTTFPILSKFILKSDVDNHFSLGKSVKPLAFLSKNGAIVNTIPFICWDILFASTHQAVNIEQAQLITSHTSGRLFGNKHNISITGMKNYTILRSVEARKSVAQSSTTGFSFLTNPFGEVQDIIEPFSDGYSIARIPLKSGLSFYSKYPNLFPLICLFILILLSFFKKHE